MTRRLDLLHPGARAKLDALTAAASARGLNFIVTNTLRTDAEQHALFAQGRKALSEVNRLRKEAGLPPITEAENKRTVTGVSVSIHQFGLAFDVALLCDGRPHWDAKADVNKDGSFDYEELGKLGESLGLTWGGRFKFRDLVHFEYTGGLTMADLKAGKRPA